MTRTASTALPSLAEAAAFTPQQIIDQFQNLTQQVDALQQQVDWFKRQLFGQKSEKRLPLEINAVQVTCRLHQIDPYTYLVDVLQRVGSHPNAEVAQLTPRLWKQHFADKPLRSDLYARRE